MVILGDVPEFLPLMADKSIVNSYFLQSSSLSNNSYMLYTALLYLSGDTFIKPDIYTVQVCMYNAGADQAFK